MSPPGGLRLLVILNSGAVNGAVRQMLHWLPHLPPDQYRVLIVFLRQRGPLGAQLVGRCHASVEVQFRNRHDIMRGIRALTLARAWRPDVTYSIDERNAMAVARAVGAVSRTPVIHAIHSSPVATPARGWERSTRHMVSRFIALSETHRAHLEGQGYPPDRITVVYNGVEDKDPNGVAGSTDGAVVCLFAGVLREDKRVDVLLDAVALAAERVPRLRLVIAGDGPLRPTLEEHATRRGIANRVSWQGWVQDTTSLLRRADVLALSSDPGVETLSMAALEAMAMAVPVVSTEVGSMREVVTPETGALVPPGDAQAMADALVLLCENAPLRTAMGHAARARQRQLFSASCLRREMERLIPETALQCGRSR